MSDGTTAKNYHVTPSDGGEAYTMAGDVYTFVLNSEDTGGLCAVVEGWIAPKGGPVMHLHEREGESWYVLEGTFEFDTEAGVTRGGPGTTVYGPRGKKHRFRNVGDAPGRLLMTIVPGPGSNLFKEAATKLPSRFSAPKVPDENDTKSLTELAKKYGNELFPNDEDPARVERAAKKGRRLRRAD